MERIPEDGADDPATGDSDAGDTAGWVDPGDGEVDYALDDPIAEADFADELVTTDGVAGETVWDGPGDGNDGPTGGAEGEIEPDYDEHDPEGNPDDGIVTQDDLDEEGI